MLLALIRASSDSEGNAQFEDLCRERGWNVQHPQRTVFLLTVSGSTGSTAWQYAKYNYRAHWVSAAAGGFKSCLSRWVTTAATLPGEVVVVYPKSRSHHDPGGWLQSGNWTRLGDMGVDLTALAMLYGQSQDADSFSRLLEIEAGSESLRQTYRVLATSEKAARAWLAKADSTLTEWAASSSTPDVLKDAGFVLWRHGLYILIPLMIGKITTLETLNNLGVTLANQVGGWERYSDA